MKPPAKPARHRVAITGMGCVSPLGLDASTTLGSLRQARDCVEPVRLFDVSTCQSKTAGQISEEMESVAQSIRPRAKRWSRASKSVLVALDEALRQRPGFAPEFLIAATTSGGMSSGEEFYRAVREGQKSPRARTLVRDYVPQQPLLDTMDHFGISAPLRIVSNACASGSNALGLAFQLVRGGVARRVLAGGYDTIAELVFAGFDCLRASTAEKCRPFDSERTGLVLGEGAAFFCIENFDDALESGAEVLAEITGYGSAADNYHLTQPDPSGTGPLLAMRRAIEDAGRAPEDISYINAHGTATAHNDACEGIAIRQLCPGAAVSSTKGMMGHALGAAGAIEAAFCVHALRGGFMPANINFRQPAPEAPDNIVANEVRLVPPAVVLSNSFGFGGSNATLILEKGLS